MYFALFLIRNMVPYFLSENTEYFQEKRKSSIFHEQHCLALHTFSKHVFFLVCKKLACVSNLISGQTPLISKSMALALLQDLYWITYCSTETWDERKLMKVPPIYSFSILLTLFFYCKKNRGFKVRLHKTLLLNLLL